MIKRPCMKVPTQTLLRVGLWGGRPPPSPQKILLNIEPSDGAFWRTSDRWKNSLRRALKITSSTTSVDFSNLDFRRNPKNPLPLFTSVQSDGHGWRGRCQCACLEAGGGEGEWRYEAVLEYDRLAAESVLSPSTTRLSSSQFWLSTDCCNSCSGFIDSSRVSNSRIWTSFSSIWHTRAFTDL